MKANQNILVKGLHGNPDTLTRTGNAKIKPEHYAHMLSEIRKIATPDMIAIHRRYLTNENKAKDVEKRLRWDFSYSARLIPFICDNLYSYANDTHIDTALRSIIKTCEASPLSNPTSDAVKP